MWFLEMKSPGHPHVKRIEVMAKMRIAAANGARDRDACAVSGSVARKRSGGRTACQAGGQRIVSRDSCVQGISGNVGKPAVAKARDVEILRNAGSPSPDGREVKLPGYFHVSREHKTVTLIGHCIAFFDVQIAYMHADDGRVFRGGPTGADL